MKKSIAILLAWSINRDSRAQRSAVALSEIYDIEIYCLTNREDEPDPKLLLGIPIHRAVVPDNSIQDKIFLPFYSSSKKLYHFFVAKKKSFNAIYCHDLPALLSGHWISRDLKVPIILDIHDLYLETINQGFELKGVSFFNKVKRKMLKELMTFFIFQTEKRLIQKVELVFSTNEYFADFMKKKYGVSCLFVRNYPILTPLPKEERLRKAIGLNAHSKIVLYHGNLGRGRHLTSIVQSSHLFSPNIYLVIIGSGELLEELKRNSSPNTIFIDYVPYEDLFEYSSGADVGLMLLEHMNYSKKHASANKVYEYMASGLPVIVSNSPELVSVVKDNAIGVVVEKISAEGIAKSVNNLFIDPQYSKQMGQKARKLYEEKYNWNQEKEVLLKMMNDLV